MDEIRVRCFECRSKFKGSHEQIAELAGCPSCGAPAASLVLLPSPERTIPLKDHGLPPQFPHAKVTESASSHLDLNDKSRTSSNRPNSESGGLGQQFAPQGYFNWNGQLVRLSKHLRVRTDIGVLPSIWTRFWAALIDYVVGLVGSLFFVWFFSSQYTSVSDSQTLQGLAWLIYIAYLGVGDSAGFGGTLGKRALGLKVVNCRGEPISGWAGLGRGLLKFIGHPFAWGLMIGYSNDERQGLHDMATQSYVVEAKISVDFDSLPYIKSPKFTVPQ